MGKVDIETIPVSSLPDKEIGELLKKNSLSLTIDECRRIAALIGRDPTLAELHVFNIEWSEHCSYKSSKETLKLLPTSGPTVILGPKEDAGIMKFAKIDGVQYGIVVSHESHNHPSQVVPYEGAATGVGGNIRDVLCMGAHVISSGDALRFGDPEGKNRNKVKYVANAVIDGVAGYGNPLGVPIICGDTFFSESFDENCLVNVVAFGIVREDQVIHSCVPEGGEGYDIIIVGKATDNSGFGGAAMASVILDESDEEYNKGAVQVPDPFLKNVIVRATEKVFEESRKQKITLGFKDMGAGGIMCSTSELCSSGGFGGIVDLSKVHVSMKGLPPYVIACGETQERFTWISPPSFTPTILRIYNEDFQLPKVSEGARASVIGKVTKEKDFILTFGGKTVCNVPVDVVTEGIRYKREKRAVKREFTEPELPEPRDFGKAALEVLRQPNIASKAPIFRHYDTEVQGLTVIRPGEADAGVQAPIPGKFAGMAAALDHNPRYSHIDPYLGAANAVAESMRNVAAVGAVPYAMTDCLNMGNPEVPESFNDFVETVKGLSDAARALWLKGHKETPVPFISGNVSFYNESASGKQIDPSPVVCCIGVLDDYRKAITMELKNSENIIFLAGDRKDELGGSAYYAIRHEYGANVPNLDFAEQRNMIYAVIDCIGSGLLESCHDISDGGMLAAVAEMILAKQGDEKVGAEIDIGDLGYENKSGNPDLRADKLLFSETPGFIFEVKMGNAGKVKDIFKSHSIDIDELGKTTGNGSLVIRQNDKPILDLAFRQMDEAWSNGLLEALR